MRRAFTLIELLAVVSIIVLLLALLAPALDRAIYQGELATCGARIKGITTGTITAAIDYKRKFPDRAGLASPHMVKESNGTNQTDTRPIMKQYLGELNVLLTCPFNKPVDLEGSKDTSRTYATYWMWFGWRYNGPLRTERGMMRLGDRWTWQEKAYDFFIQDYDVVSSAANQTSWNTHPDAKGVLRSDAAQDVGGPPGFTYSIWWINGANVFRGLVDMNFGSSDASVQRLTSVESSIGTTGEHDDRTDVVSNFQNGGAGQWGLVPR